VLKVVENLWAVGALPETPLGSSQRSPGLLAGEGVAAPPKNSTPALGLRFFGLALPQ